MDYDNRCVIYFDAGFDKNLEEEDFLSPSWFDRKAKDLLVKIQEAEAFTVCSKLHLRTMKDLGKNGEVDNESKYSSKSLDLCFVARISAVSL